MAPYCLKIAGSVICYCVICPQVLETYSYEDIGEVSNVKNSGLQLAMHTGGRVVVTTNKAGKQIFKLFVFVCLICLKKKRKRVHTVLARAVLTRPSVCSKMAFQTTNRRLQFLYFCCCCCCHRSCRRCLQKFQLFCSMSIVKPLLLSVIYQRVIVKSFDASFQLPFLPEAALQIIVSVFFQSQSKSIVNF